MGVPKVIDRFDRESTADFSRAVRDLAPPGAGGWINFVSTAAGSATSATVPNDVVTVVYFSDAIFIGVGGLVKVEGQFRVANTTGGGGTDLLVRFQYDDGSGFVDFGNPGSYNMPIVRDTKSIFATLSTTREKRYTVRMSAIHTGVAPGATTPITIAFLIVTGNIAETA